MVVVTTIRKVNDDLIMRAQEIAAFLNTKYVPRRKEGISKIKERYNADVALVVKSNQLILDLPEGEMFFHPNMAQVRIKRLRYGTGGRDVFSSQYGAGAY